MSGLVGKISQGCEDIVFLTFARISHSVMVAINAVFTV